MLIGPQFLAGAVQRQQRVVLDSVLDAVLIPVSIPVQQTRVFERNIFPRWCCLGTFASGIVTIAVAKQAAATRRGLHKHAIAAWARRAVRPPMPNHVGIPACTKGWP